MKAPRCPACRAIVVADESVCTACGTQIGFHLSSSTFHRVEPDGVLIDGVCWWRCSNAFWGCNWLIAEDTGSGECVSCRLTRRGPNPDDTPALEKLAAVEVDKRVMIGHANGVITLDLAESLDAHQEARCRAVFGDERASYADALERLGEVGKLAYMHELIATDTRAPIAHG